MSHTIHPAPTLAALAALTLPLAAQKAGIGGVVSLPAARSSAPAIQVAKVPGGGKDRKALREARSFRQLKLTGATVAANVAKLTRGLRWHGSLAGALAAGRTAGKPVLFIQALGDLDGFL